jgi:hypothetical protein
MPPIKDKTPCRPEHVRKRFRPTACQLKGALANTRGWFTQTLTCQKKV